MIEVTRPWGARMWVNAAYMTGAPPAAVEEPTAAAVPKVISHGALPADAPTLPNAASAAPAPLPADAGASPEGESGSDAAALARLSPLQPDAALPVPEAGAIVAQAAAPDCADTQMENDMMEIDGEAVDVATLKQALLLIKKRDAELAQQMFALSWRSFRSVFVCNRSLAHETHAHFRETIFVRFSNEFFVECFCNNCTCLLACA